MGKAAARFARYAVLCGVMIPWLFQYPLFTADQEGAFKASSPREAPGGFLVIRGAGINIYYDPDVDLRRVERRFRRSFFFGGGGSSSGDAAYDLASRLESLLSNVKSTLGMYPTGMTITIKIFKTREDLNEAYYNIFRTDENYISFYIHKFETIYTTERDISYAIMAHEMAHAVTDHYFGLIPPDAIRELLATYVEENIE